MRCHYIHEKGKKIFIACCYGAMYDDNAKNCTCESEHGWKEVDFQKIEEYKSQIKELIDANKSLEKQNMRLIRLINNLNKRGAKIKIY
ncbi:hypothetical protein [Flectobacillus sp. BAB-3569]|uniref:hypothetical protein n=1 Tax=Flectobacillus sp. BAB-3569 TaxID=1509483 RepID=UPI000BA461E4|nr:hypothetical protein [Flectobacillus sp. BAB-3569]PAC27828.1 hypothetical protein BWI92_21695 [Flectobacillus sp. BAB-3569]